MKKINKIKHLVMITMLTFLAVSCSNEDKNQGIQLNANTFDKLEIDFTKDYSVAIGNSKSINSITEILMESVNGAKEMIRQNEEIVGLKYQITFESNSLNFHNIVTVSEADLHQAKTGEPVRPAGPFDNTVWECPDGQTLIERCYSEECVKETIRGLAANFSSGETITVHHGGISGVRICADAQ